VAMLAALYRTDEMRGHMQSPAGRRRSAPKR
jgi:hypothetical protein